MKKSFTLIEILVAIFLLSLLLATAMFSFRLFIKSSDSVSVNIPKKAIAYEWIDKSISGMYPYVLQENNNYKYFIHYNKKKLTYVSSIPLYYTDLVLVQLECKDNKLIYKESPIYNKFQNYKNPKIIENNSTKMVLLDNLEKCQINCKKNKNFLKEVDLILNSQKWIFTPKNSWVNLKKILKGKVEIR